MKDRIKDYFAFNSKEQRGLIVLLGLMLCLLLINVFLPIMVKEKPFDINPFREEVAMFLAEMEKADSAEQNKSHVIKDYTNEKNNQVLASFRASPFHFNPNELSEDDWQAMGMDERIAKNIIRYREKGGKFRDKEGFSRIYGMNDGIYGILEPYIRIPAEQKKYQENDAGRYQQNSSTDQQKKYEKYEPEPVMIELNSADSSALLALTGIGPSYAGRIIKYRDRLGGYYIKEQLLEIKGMDSIRFNQFKDQITIDSARIRKIDLNTVAFKDLLKHPYFEYYLVKAVFQKKDEIRAFESVEQIRDIPVMYQELYQKISVYLEVR
jgi:DNA uptake protein ComE-like DNA-binding protein